MQTPGAMVTNREHPAAEDTSAARLMGFTCARYRAIRDSARETVSRDADQSGFEREGRRLVRRAPAGALGRVRNQLVEAQFAQLAGS